MIIPIRCFTCGNIIASKYDRYKQLIEEKQNQIKDNSNEWKQDLNVKKEHILVCNNKLINNIYNSTMEEVGIQKYCCKRHILGHIEILKLL